ncbi:hypothetical protein A7H89_07500 [Escherichia coli]|nr:hypothetical protein A7H85_17150 [Escherichia coli]PBS32445.1 hypothetical protein A7H86_17105 [Escherichia coli]PBS37944.1 hypothetical protein A7H87_14080 [Escherichia coli]PBS44404.1 hypothetical protein A7H88_06760 [Escherichia coli]PBS49068.1 hypothetical protein A7H89_07500 [Escherichia coli]
MSIYIDGRDCCQTGQFSQDVADGALTGYPSQNLLLKMALTPICCSNDDNNGARESCYYLLQRAPSYFL